MMTIKTHSTADTEAVGARLARWIIEENISSPFVALFGDMGVGKTAFTRGFGRELGILRVKSPTYTVVNEYRGPSHTVYHFDLYRLQGIDDLEGIGYGEYLSSSAIKLCEWSERLGDDLPDQYIRVDILRDEGDTREIIITQNITEGSL